MELIKNNPHRLLGVLVGTSPKVVLNRVNNLKIYLSAEEEIPEEELPYGFDRIGKIVRTLETVNTANSKLNIESEKILNSIFWFYEGSKVGDKDAFEAIREGDLENAAEVWQAMIGKKDINASNASAFHNLSILKINAAFKSSRVFVNMLEEAVLMQIKFLESKYSDSFFYSFIDTHDIQDKSKYQLVFLKAIQEELDKYESVSSDKIFEIVSKVEFAAKDEFLRDSIQKPIRLIESLIIETKDKRNDNARDAEIYGRELYENSSELIAQVKNVLGKGNIKYKSISDKLADEILQCGIDFFNEFKEEDFDPSDDAMELFRHAKQLAEGDLIKQRVKEHIEGLQGWIDSADERIRQKLIKGDLEFIAEKLDQFGNLPETIKKAKELVDTCWPKILNMRRALGSDDDLYLNLSTAVVSHAQGTLVECVNNKVNEYGSSAMFAFLSPSLRNAVEEALDLTFKIGLFDMHPSFKAHYTKNLESLKKLASQISVSTLSPKEKAQNELTTAQSKLRDIQNSTPLATEIMSANAEMDSLKEWQFLRTQETKDRQIAEQNKKIEALKARSDLEKAAQINAQEKKIRNLKQKFIQTEY